MLVQWQSREAATLHILVIRAMVVLLTHGPPPPPSPQSEPDSQVVDYFSLLQEMWFPSNGQHPQVYFVETSEEALLYPDWLKLRMIKSNVPVLVDTALKDLEPRQLILFIQSFGIPVSSMSKLLQALDRMVQTNPFAFVEVDIDKVYMKRLLQVRATVVIRSDHIYCLFKMLKLHFIEFNLLSKKKECNHEMSNLIYFNDGTLM